MNKFYKVLHTVGLKSNGTVVAIGDNEYGQCNISIWKGFFGLKF